MTDVVRVEKGQKGGGMMTSPYRQGFIDAISAYAHWHDGAQYVGTTGRTLKEAIEKIDATYSYDARQDLHYRQLITAAEAVLEEYDDTVDGEYLPDGSMRGGGHLSSSIAEQLRAAIAKATGAV